MQMQPLLNVISQKTIVALVSMSMLVQAANGIVLDNQTNDFAESQLFNASKVFDDDKDVATDTKKVFGEQLFRGNFAATSGSTFSDDYLIKAGDNIQVRLWGAYEYAATVIVDAQGTISLPNVAPLKVSGIKNSELNEVVRQAVQQAYRSKISVYASLEAAQPLKVFVTGFVNQPGYYSGLASDSVLAYLDRAGGVDSKRGSYIDIQIRRAGDLIQQVNLYDFLLAGQLPSFSFNEGDIIKVSPQQKTFTVGGAVRNDYTFEYGVADLTLGDVLTIANPQANASQVRIVRKQKRNSNLNDSKLKDSNNDVSKSATDTATTTYRLTEAQNIAVQNGDIIWVS